MRLAQLETMTKRKAGTTVRASEDEIHRLFDRAPVLAKSIDATGRILHVSRAWAERLGYRPEEMIGHDSAEFLTEDSATRLYARALPALMAQGTCRDIPVDVIRPDGSSVSVLVSASAEFDADGVFRRALAFMADTTQTRAALTALERKAEEAEEASLAKSRFLAAMSHEIRTPMNAILGFAQLLELSDLDQERKSHVRAILSAGNALMGLLRDLLDLSQVEAGAMQIEPRTIVVHALVDEVAAFWQRAARDRGLVFSIVLDPALPRYMVADPLRIKQVLNNYLGNAVKFTPSGNVTLSVSILGTPRRQTLSEGTAMTLRFEVTDTGPGLAEADVDRLFVPFVRASGSAAEMPPGWGLGLSICKSIADAMGADVGVDTAPGDGARFRFDLPVLVPDKIAEDTEAPGAEPIPETAPLRILLAEDNTLNQDVMRRLLIGLGHTVETVSNGFEAVEAVDAMAKAPFDAMIIDLMMPGLDGAGAIRRIRERGGPAADLPVIACSAHGEPILEQKLEGLKVDYLLSKPVTRLGLANALAQAVSRRAGTG